MNNIIRYFSGILFIIVLILLIYTIIDNNRVNFVEQDIVIEHLSEDLEGFTILQITDLHEKEFGKDQSRLIKRVNSTSYDAIVFTGDMLDSKKSKNYGPFSIY